MTRKVCGCYDGPYSSDTPNILVSVRCPQHIDNPVLPHHSLSYISVSGQVTHLPQDQLTAAQKARATNAKRAQQVGNHPQKVRKV